jgi:hypothetical protein
MRERIEDLGRISVMIDVLLEAETWDLYGGRNKDFLDYFSELEEEKKDDLLHKLIYGLSNIKDKLYEISVIADGMDPLNDPPQI